MNKDAQIIKMLEGECSRLWDEYIIEKSNNAESEEKWELFKKAQLVSDLLFRAKQIMKRKEV